MTGRCHACRLRADRCLCALIPRIETRTPIVILRHRMERFKPSNTARLAALALPGCTIVDYGMGAATESAIAAPGTWLLWPDGPPATAPPPVERLLVLDGSWPQARRMVQRIPALRGLPRLSLPPPSRPPERLRRQRLAEGMATIEAIARALELLEGPAPAQALDRLYAEFVSRSLPLSGGRAARRTS
jgi:DTW domain-containing protein